jgi:hypothetical protein
MTGLDDFKIFLKEFRGLAAWAAGGSIVFPFIASFLSIIPPWPSGLNSITAVFQLVSLIYVFQFYSVRGTEAKRIGLLFALAFVVIMVYILAFSVLTIYIPEVKRSLVVGFQCTSKALIVFPQKCPFLDLDDLSGVSFDEFQLWTKWSISLARCVLIALWFAFFIVISSLIGKFLIFQMNRSAARTPAGGSAAGN